MFIEHCSPVEIAHRARQSKVNNMDGLFDDLVLIILDQLDLVSLANCRSVCKRFQFLVRKIRKHELVLNNTGLVDTWFHTDRLVNYDNALFQDYAFRLLKTSGSPAVDLRYLRRLKICYADNAWYKKDKFELKILNNFIHLKQLEIKLTGYKSDEVISLPNLAILSLELTDSKFSEIASPNLYALFYSCFYSNDVLDPVNFRSPETIRHLEINGTDRGIELFRNVEIFKSYEHVKNVMSLFPKLKELHSYCILDEICLRHLESIKNEVQQLKEKKRAFEKPELRMFLFGVELLDDKPMADYNFGQRLFALHMSNYSNLAERLRWFNKINYADLSDHLTSLPAGFFEKYGNIQVVNAESVGSQKEFMNFLSNLKNLNLLELRNNSLLDQEFYDSLPTIRTLTGLTINENQDVRLDLNFIYELKLLQRFSTDQPLSIERMLSAFVKLRFFEKINITNQDDSFFIWKRNGYCHLHIYEKVNEYNELKHSKKRFKLKRLREICNEDGDLDREGLKTNCGFIDLIQSFIKK